jgi:hypothetical protein
MLRAFVNYKQNNWDEYLALVEFAYNNSVQASTGVTPFFANYGQPPSTPTSLFLKKPDNLVQLFVLISCFLWMERN